jgi:hypothetical protein
MRSALVREAVKAACVAIVVMLVLFVAAQSGLLPALPASGWSVRPVL